MALTPGRRLQFGNRLPGPISRSCQMRGVFMKRLFSLVATVIFFWGLPGPTHSQQESGIPPMLESRRPMATPNIKPAPQPPEGNKAQSSRRVKNKKATRKAQKTKRAKRAQMQKSGKRKADLAGKKKASKKKAVKKKGETAKPRRKSTANST